MFKFIYVKHKEMKNICGWYLDFGEPKLSSIKNCFEILDAASTGYAQKCFLNYDDKNNYKCMTPITRATSFSTGITNAILNGLHVWMNCNGGWMLASDKYDIVAAKENERLVFPDSNKMCIEIIKWKDGKHYYLHSKDMQIISLPKYDDLETALNVAKQITSNVNIKEHFTYTKEGD